MKIQEIGAFEAKTKLSELLEKVQRGQRFCITKRGKPVAVLQSPETRNPRKDGKAAVSLVELSCQVRARWKPGPETIKQLIAEGRKW